MKITTLHIENFRSIRLLDLALDETTVFIGPNNAGKSAILEALRIALSRRWGQQGTGFTENDVHCPNETTDPRTAPPVKIGIVFEEPATGAWPADMVADLDDVTTITSSGLNRIAFSVVYSWNSDTKTFEPGWEFLDSSGNLLPLKRRSVNFLSDVFNYLPFFWLDALRDADDEFAVRSRHWGGLLKSIQIPPELEAEVKASLDALDAKLLAADPRFKQISDTIGHATEISIGDTPGAAKLRMLPLNLWDLLSRAGVVLRNEDLRPWLPLDHHGQGLQSLSVMFLFQAAAFHRLSEQAEGAEPIFAIEEPEVHLHPQAARTLWTRVSQLPGQKLVTTHSPYFVQRVPLHNLRIVRSRNGATEVSLLPRNIHSELLWTPEVDKLITGRRWSEFTKEPSGRISATTWFDAKTAEELADCWKTSADASAMRDAVAKFRRDCRVLVAPDEEAELAFLGRRVRGEIFFAREWVLVEGPSEYLLLHAMGQALGYDLDQHGISIIDFQNNGNASIYPALADAFSIPWRMVTDGDAESERFKTQLTKRGYSIDDIATHFFTLTPPNDLETQLLTDGHERLLRDILVETGTKAASSCSLDDLKKFLGKRKTAYIAILGLRIASNPALANQMPAPFVKLIADLKSGAK